MKNYQVRGIDLDHDGKRYPEGSTIALDDQAAIAKRRWLDPQGPVEPPNPPEQAAPATPAKAAKAGKADDKKFGDGVPVNPETDSQGSGQSEGDKQ